MNLVFRRVVAAALLALLPSAVLAQSGPTVVRVTSSVKVPDVLRFGINIGERTTWGASQILKNLLPNPGFEAGLYGMVVHPDVGPTGQRIPQAFWSTNWNNDPFRIGQPEGFWDGAEYEFVLGPALGRSGTIAQHAHESGQSIFYLDSDGTAPSAYDVLFLRTQVPHLSHAGSFAAAAPGVARPGSPGTQSMVLTSTPFSWQASWTQFLDTYWTTKADSKLLVVKGSWHLKFWARADMPGTQLRVRFDRQSEATFFEQTIPLTTQWKKYVRNFSVPRNADFPGPYGPADPRPVLGLSLFVDTPGAQVWLDDAALSQNNQTNPTVFTDRLVQRLQELQPGILRNLSNVHGDSLDNQLAEPLARRTHGYSPARRDPDTQNYSLHEFLDLCQTVGADPYYPFPAVFTPAEIANLMEYLGGTADGNSPYADRRAALGQVQPWTQVFDTIYLEFSTEGWGSATVGDPFFGASLLGGYRLGQIADDRFALLKSSPYYAADDFRLVIGGQAEFTGRQTEIESNSSSHDAIGVAPYFGLRMDEFATPADLYLPLWAHAREDVLPGGKVWTSQNNLDLIGQDTDLFIYEMNFSTTGTDYVIPESIRNDFVSGLGGGLALPLYQLLYLSELGIREHCAFTVLQYNTTLGNGDEVNLFGLLRDLYGSANRRPAWLGLRLANEALAGDLMRTVVEDSPTFVQPPQNDLETQVTMPYIHAFAFQDGADHSLLLFNLDLDQDHPVAVSLPRAHAPDLDLAILTALNISDDNEVARTVRISRVAPQRHPSRHLQFLMPRHSMLKLAWRDFPRNP